MSGARSRRKGYRAEAAVVTYLRANGFPNAVRRSSGAAGPDIDELGPGLELEVKDHARWELGAWLDQLAVAMDATDAVQGAVIVKRSGTTDVGDWWFCQTRDLTRALHDAAGSVLCTVELGSFRSAEIAEHHRATLRIYGGGVWMFYDRHRPWLERYSITTVHHGVRLLRAAGWGTPLPEETRQ